MAKATIKLTEPQASFLELEIVERFIDDDDESLREVCWVLLSSLIASKGKSAEVWDKEILGGMVLTVINFIDDQIEDDRRGDSRALGRIGGIDTIQEARALHRVGEAILKKLR